MNRAEPSVNIQVRLKYQDSLKNPVELGPGMHHRSARPHQAADTSAPGQPARPRTLGTIRLRGGRGGSLGPRGHAAGVMAGRCGSARHAGGLRRPGGPARAGGRQASGPKTVGVRGHASGRRQHRAATEEPGISIIFKIDVGFPGQVWSSQVREAKSRCQVKRAGRLLLSAPRFAARVPGLRGVMRWDRRSSFSGKGGPNDGWLTSTANSGSGPASLVRRLASISLRPALRISERNNDLRRGPDLLSNEKSTGTDFFKFLKEARYVAQLVAGRAPNARDSPPCREQSLAARLEPLEERHLLNAAVSVIAQVAQASEVGPSPAIFGFTRTGDLSSPLQANFSLGGTAQSGVDYQVMDKTAGFDAGSSTAYVTVMPINVPAKNERDGHPDTDSGAGYTVGTAASATATIADAYVPGLSGVFNLPNPYLPVGFSPDPRLPVRMTYLQATTQGGYLQIAFGLVRYRP